MVFISFMAQEAGAVATELTPARAAELIAADAELIDVRQAVEWEGGRIAGARHIELNALTAASESIPGDRPVVFYCRSGSRSGMAAEAFRQAGYEAYNLAGGIEAWASAGRPLEPPGAEIRHPPPAS